TLAYPHSLPCRKMTQNFEVVCRTQHIPIPSSDSTIVCDVSTGVSGPFVPAPSRKAVFQHLHSISHPGIRATAKLISERFCLQCQRSKVQLHTITSPAKFLVPHRRVQHVHIDIVGPLPASKSFTHILTAIDSFTRWTIACPINDISAENIASVFLDRWISNFGVHTTLALFREFTRLLGIHHISTTAYHPAANGLVERFHRQLKTSLMSQPDMTLWSYALPMVLLGIRNTIKEDIGYTSSQLVYGTTLTLPRQLVNPPEENPSNGKPETIFIDRLKPAFVDSSTDTSVENTPLLTTRDQTQVSNSAQHHQSTAPTASRYMYVNLHLVTDIFVVVMLLLILITSYFYHLPFVIMSTRDFKHHAFIYSVVFRGRHTDISLKMYTSAIVSYSTSEIIGTLNIWFGFQFISSYVMNVLTVTLRHNICMYVNLYHSDHACKLVCSYPVLHLGQFDQKNVSSKSGFIECRNISKYMPITLRPTLQLVAMQLKNFKWQVILDVMLLKQVSHTSDCYICHYHLTLTDTVITTINYWNKCYPLLHSDEEYAVT
ncbi:Pro-Pol polyprotein, partial [Schistosoma japonicum]